MRTFWGAVHPPKRTSPPLSSAFEPALRLEPSASLLLELWWVGLHALLAVAALFAAAPVPLRLAILVGALCHGAARRPASAPAVIVMGADGTCVVPQWGASRLALLPQTLICPYWVRLALETGPQRRDILLLADQLPAVQWAQLAARLRRVRCR